MHSLNGDWKEHSSEGEYAEEYSSPLDNNVPMRIMDIDCSKHSEEHSKEHSGEYSSNIPSREESSLEALELICSSTPCLDPGDILDF